LIYNSRNIRVGIVDLRPYFDHLQFNGGHVTYNGIIERLDFIEGDYFFGLHYNVNHSVKDLFNLAGLRIKSGIYEGSIKKYLARHRGIVEIKHYPTE
jgi:hypothetical protein